MQHLVAVFHMNVHRPPYPNHITNFRVRSFEFAISMCIEQYTESTRRPEKFKKIQLKIISNNKMF